MSDVSNVSGCSIGSFSQVARSAHFSKIAVLKKTLLSKTAAPIMFPKFLKDNRQPARKQAARLDGKYCLVSTKYHLF